MTEPQRIDLYRARLRAVLQRLLIIGYYFVSVLSLARSTVQPRVDRSNYRLIQIERDEIALQGCCYEFNARRSSCSNAGGRAGIEAARCGARSYQL